MSPTENIAKAFELKETGNTFFKAGEYRKAMGAYHEIFMYVHGLDGSGGAMIPGRTTQPVSDEEKGKIRELKLVHHSNLAMCHLKLGNVEKAHMNCVKALAMDPRNVKALFRRAKCHAQMNALDEAKADLDAVLQVDPSNKEAVRELQALRQRLASHRRKEQRKFAGMFDKLSAEQAIDEVTGGDTAAEGSSEQPSTPVMPMVASEAAAATLFEEAGETSLAGEHAAEGAGDGASSDTGKQPNTLPTPTATPAA